MVYTAVYKRRGPSHPCVCVHSLSPPYLPHTPTSHRLARSVTHATRHTAHTHFHTHTSHVTRHTSHSHSHQLLVLPFKPLLILRRPSPSLAVPSLSLQVRHSLLPEINPSGEGAWSDWWTGRANLTWRNGGHLRMFSGIPSKYTNFTQVKELHEERGE